VEYLQLETAKETIRHLQELDDSEFDYLYQRDTTEQIDCLSSTVMSHLSGQQSTITNNDNQSLLANLGRIISPSTVKREQYFERTLANDQAYDEIHDLRIEQTPSMK
jgi:hypothetical protein